MFDLPSLNEAALGAGFKRKGKQNWHCRTEDFIQLVNFQKSMWDKSDFYINFALWPLALGEPESISEYRFLFTCRAEQLKANDPQELFAAASELRTLEQLGAAMSSGALAHAMVSPRLKALLASQ